jgi:hypothetical protein
MSKLSRITREHVELAIADLNAGKQGAFKLASKYKMVHNGKLYAPKMVIENALRHLDGTLSKYRDFYGGWGPQGANTILENLGYQIVGTNAQSHAEPRTPNPIHIPQRSSTPVIDGVTNGFPSDNLSNYATQLMEVHNHCLVGEIDNLVPNEPGLYCLRILRIDALPEPYAQVLRGRGHNIVYIGIASQSLKKRFLEQELRAKGHGTFFRSVGAMLGYRPLLGSLINKANQNNYRFAPETENKIIQWMNVHLTAKWITFHGDCNELENLLIPRHLPLLNLQCNPAPLRLLEDARQECRDIARSGIFSG